MLETKFSKLKFCKVDYPYTCYDNEICPVCSHYGYDHIFRLGKSFCRKCNEGVDI